MNGNSESLEKLESHVAHLERLIDQLNDVVVGQAQELERLKKQFGRVSLTLENAELDRIKSVDARPPHYQ
ncbi:MAG: SlyX family protein [Verrucomicrobiota bacterium]